ncbi:MAG: prepilin-type N-terminal cleavage/methylation domain-containing protein [Opitutaceae bacterium]|jgi:prepilin-type N-terminal cleavage/methylation domain-containing protein/prepilin-type processing-associated H-X9-DG protein|nr:prepilin-type N-terminal cleavage/methylation domain-containing protein [Opitutaceae bacterium]
MTHLRQNRIQKPVAQAFTLIELLTVIAIIGILAAIIIPVTGRVRASARTTKCLSSLRQIGVASQAYAAENKDRITPGFYPTDNSDPLSLYTFVGILAPYTGWQNPSASDTAFASLAVIPSIFFCPERQDQWGYSLKLEYLSWPGGSWAKGWKTLGQATHASRTVFITESTLQDGNKWRPFVMWNASSGWPTPDYRHPGDVANTLWLDGHVSAEKESRLGDETCWKLD